VNNDLVASMDVGVGGLNLARWYEFTTSGTPALVAGQQGNISPGSGISTSYPSIAIDPGGDIAISYIQSSSTQPYSMYVTGRLASDPVGTLQTGVEIAAGVLPVPSALRGGDYSATEYDPASNSQFWSANEYNFNNSGSNYDWGTQIAAYTLGSSGTADLSLNETGPSTLNEGGSGTYSFTVTNAGPNSAPNTVLTDNLDPNSKFVSATISQGTFSQSGGVITFSFGTLTSGQTVTATVTAQAAEDGTLTNSSSVTSSATDPTPGDNSASWSTTVMEVPISVSSPITLSGKRFINVQVATFTHASGVEPPSAFIATIAWGDGKTSTGTITESGTTYVVTGSHNYSRRGTYTVSTTVVESGSTPNFAQTSGHEGLVKATTPSPLPPSSASAASVAPTSSDAFVMARLPGAASAPESTAGAANIGALYDYASILDGNGFNLKLTGLRQAVSVKPRTTWRS
jgi:uncharacterized repeat protein (TIGR01451 family)